MGEAESVTTVPSEKVCEHVLGQEIPDGLLLTVPEPTSTMVSRGLFTNVAVTDVVVLRVNVQVELLPVHPPVYPINVYPAPGVSDSVTEPFAIEAEHELGQFIPVGLLVTVPVPTFVTVNVELPVMV